MGRRQVGQASIGATRNPSRMRLALQVARTLRMVVEYAATLAIVICLTLLIAQRYHPAELAAVLKVLHRWADPSLAKIAGWSGMRWPSRTFSYVPLIAAAAVWFIKVVITSLLHKGELAFRSSLAVQRAERGALASKGGEADLVAADSEQTRAQLLKKYREIEDALKNAERKPCTFLSIDIIGSTGMKEGEEDAKIAATFQAYEELLRKTFREHNAWKQAWTPDGVMICFLDHDLAVGATKRILTELRNFNTVSNKLRTPLHVRCGVNAGEVTIFQDSKLEKIADHAIDVAGHMQKHANADALWLSAEVYESLSDKSGFHPVDRQVDGFNVYEWTVEAPASTSAHS